MRPHAPEACADTGTGFSARGRCDRARPRVDRDAIRLKLKALSLKSVKKNNNGEPRKDLALPKYKNQLKDK